ncbi:MFS sugar transporter [Aspergillus ambiguus]|uniref:MFS sugar transporter n=1 Tax=Aspergillus ambiguus TaxID=176160 RepID=UPI003CCD79EA
MAFNTTNLLVVVYVALGSTSCAYSLAVLGGVIGQPSFYSSLNLAPEGTPGYDRTAQLLGAFNGVQSAGACVGTIYNSWSANALSRKRTIQIGAIVTVISAALCAGSVNVGMFVFARFVSGLGLGILGTCIPVYQSEIAPPELRGLMVSMHGVMFGVGYSLSAWLNFGLYFMTQNGSTSTFPWRFPMAFQCVPALMMLVGSPWLPFSPRWLVSKQRYAEAKDVLQRLHSRKGDDNHDIATREFQQIKEQLEIDLQIREASPRFQLLRTAPNRKRSLIAASMMWFNMFTGVLILSNYGLVLFKTLGLDEWRPLLLLGIWLTVSIPANITTALIVDKVGRRPILLVGASGILVSLICECVLQALYADSSNKSGQIAACFFIYLFILFWGVCIDATQYLYMSEIFPTRIRPQGAGFAIWNQQAATIVVLVAGPIALERISWRFFLVLIIPTTLYIPVIYFFFPETKKRSLEDINSQFGEVVAVEFKKTKPVVGHLANTDP